ncbi:DUF5684 domain-containing protein [Microbacterium sp. HD4P20]|uniref:DUF5684 domain-containing protein n=1 Tax=Microbacterium sp. HD4P20 TaxID=2864874 RepID=UPI001C63EC39|nr:DUF5684 domain-containing protein [Microbacterium sp. HD4P20]MCP2638043.1 DUF5684 domain-containing protein [Microbacterium sp. HD4P20]
MNATDASGVIFGTLLSLLLVAALYVWVALALSAVFRKSGVESWKAWVPILNTVVLLQLAGLSPWLVVLAFVPVIQIAFIVVFAMAIYRLSIAFGFAIGMTVLGVLLLPVWATIIGFGSARWVGREPDASAAHAARGGSGPRRSGDTPPALPPLPSFAPSASIAPPTAPGTTGFPPASPVSFSPAPSAFSPAPAHSAATPDPAPGATPAPTGEFTPPAGGWAPPPLPSAGRTPDEGADEDPEAPATRRSGASDAGWQGFAADSTDLSSEVTGAVPGAPAPVSAVPAVPPVPPIPAMLASDEVGSSAQPASTTGDPVEGLTRPPVVRVPRGGATGDEREPWAPTRSPTSDPGGFAETSGPVSAVAGAPDAGGPRSARTSVSAQHVRPEIPDDDDVMDETIIARRRRTHWSLVPPTGDPVEIGSEVVILGRRPAADPAHPGAQLIAIQDGTVSKTHARLQLRDDRWYVTDLGSTNGVLFATLMGTEIEAPSGVEVEAGDRFLLGDAEVRLVRSDA